MMRRNWMWLAAAVALAAMMTAAACQAPARKEPDLAKLEPLKKVAVLPFQRINTPSDGGPVCCPLSGAAFRSGTIAPGAEDALNKSLADILPNITDLNIVPASRAGLVYDRLLGQVPAADARAELAETARKLGADAVLIGFVYRFEERVGEAFSAEKPASISFNLVMVSAKDARVIWKASYEETQKPLTDNLLNLGQYAQHGLKWYTAAELGRIGMENILQNFPWRKASLKTGNQG